MSVPRSRPSFFAELQRRHVYKVGAMYAVAGWLLVQIVTQVFPIFDVSAWVQRIIVLLIVAGFPVALVLAWLFDLTPQGIVRTDELAPIGPTPQAERRARSNERRLNLVLGVLVVLGLAYFVAERTLLKPGGIAGADAPADDKSIAVLPFENLSQDPDNAFFASGIQDQVLTQLAKIGALRVISRTSTQAYATRPDSVGAIAKQLGVANILEGSVQKAGDSVRINVQLIRADGDTHLWAETYDRKLENIFGVESEVAGAIAEALNTKLSGSEQKELAARPTKNPAAWEAYLRGVLLLDRGEVEADMRAALAQAEAAVQLDPQFAAAWALDSKIRGALYIGNYDSSAASREAARTSLQNALHLQPDDVEVRIAEGCYVYWIERDFVAARRILEAVRPRAPGNALIPFTLALITRREGRWSDSLKFFGEAAELDPRNPEIISQSAFTSLALRRYDLAEQYLDRLLDVSPDSSLGLAGEVTLRQMQGRLDEGDAFAARVNLDASDLIGISVLAYQKQLQRRYGEGAALMRQMLAKRAQSATPADAIYQFKLGEFLQRSGDAGGAAAAFSLARTQVIELLRTQPDNDLFLVARGVIEAALGHREAALAAIHRSIELLPPERDALLSSEHQLALALIYAKFDEQDAAIDQLQSLVKLPAPTHFLGPPITSALLRLDPAWDRLRANPRFVQLLAAADAAQLAKP